MFLGYENIPLTLSRAWCLIKMNTPQKIPTDVVSPSSQHRSTHDDNDDEENDDDDDDDDIYIL